MHKILGRTAAIGLALTFATETFATEWNEGRRTTPEQFLAGRSLPAEDHRAP